MHLQSHIILKETFELGMLYHKNYRYKENNKSTNIFGNKTGWAQYIQMYKLILNLIIWLVVFH